MVRDFEDEIVRLTGAEQIESPSRVLPTFISRRLAHGTQYSDLRRWVPREEYELKADVLWVPLMGPEDFELDLFTRWDRKIGLKILYFFDTFDTQLSSIRRVLQSAQWDVVSTAFPGAKGFLEEKTQREWQVVRHGVKLERFHPAPDEERGIDFCSYGRRLERAHTALKDYCARTAKYYDYTTAASIQPQLNAREPYAQYAWHLAHSVFNVCWPIEVTHPERVKNHSPITCRWFEAAASGNVILGQAPADAGFEDFFGLAAVIDVPKRVDELPDFLDVVWADRKRYLKGARVRRDTWASMWTWESRIRQILTTAGLQLEAPPPGMRQTAVLS